MKNLSPELQAHLDTGVTTICWCWKLIRPDGQILGFTDHDANIVFGGVVFEASSGFQASEIASTAGLNVDDLEVAGALQSDHLGESELAAGDFDNAEIEIYAVNWQDPAQRVLLRKGNLGETRRGRSAFTAEVRGLAHRLNQTAGRVFQFTCDADLGDARCGVDLETPAFKGTGEVVSVDDDARFAVSGLDIFAAQWLQRGKLAWMTGANVGRSMEIKSQGPIGSDHVIELWQPMAGSIAVGDQFEIRAGCDKQLSTCKDKFDNVKNFRGFPFMPGNDFAISYPNRGDPGNDGGSLFAD